MSEGFNRWEKLIRMAEELKYAMTDYITEDIDSFHEEFYLLCYNSFRKYEKNIVPDDEGATSENYFEKVLQVKERRSHIAIGKLSTVSKKQSFYEARNIFEIPPKRYGLRGDETIWEYMHFYFRLFEISLDLISVEEIIEIAKNILEIYFKYADCYECKEVMRKYWDENLDSLVRYRYEFLYKEMNLLCNRWE